MPESHSPPADPFSEFRPDPTRLGLAGRILWLATSVLSGLLRFAFHLLYHQLAFTYDMVAWIVSGGEWADWRRCVLPYLPPGRVLEIAHGTGTLSLEMAGRGYPVTAVDLSPAMGKIAAGKKRKWMIQARNGVFGVSNPQPDAAGKTAAGPALVRADVRRLPFPGGIFSSAVATFPADFLFHPLTYREVHRALRPGGRWIIVPTAYPEWLAKRWLPDEKSNPSDGVWGIIIQRLQECGFTVRMEIVRRLRSRVLLILVEKSGTPQGAIPVEKS